MNGLTLLIVDDEYSVRENIRFLIRTYHADKFSVIREAGTFELAVQEFETAAPDLIFLDINLGKRNGFDFLDHIKNTDARIIFITAYNEYAIKAFRYAASDYLLKPLDIEAFNEAVERVTRSEPGRKEQVSHYLVPGQHHFDFFFVPDKNRWTKIVIASIIYLEASRSYTNIVMDHGTLVITRSMNKFDFLLEDQVSFYKIHRSYIINTQKVKTIYKKQGGIVVMDNGSELPVSASERERVYRLFHID